MYNEKEIQAAVDLYEKIHSLSRVARILGYPNRATLKRWLESLKSNGSIKSLTVSKGRKYSEEQIRKAVNYCLTQGVSQRQTIRDLGYPSRQLLCKWIHEYAPRVVKRAPPPVPAYPKETKLAAVRALRLRTKAQSVISIARKFGVSRPTLYAWDKEFPKPVLETKGNIMPSPVVKKEGTPAPEGLSEQERLERALARVQELEKQVEGLSMDAEQLQRDIEHLRMQKDILVKCAEVLKKDGGASLKSLSNKEKTLVIDALRPHYKLKDLLKEFGLAKSSYCYQKVVMTKPDKYAQLRKDIQTIFAENYQRYGYRRICCCLKKNRIRVAEKVVRRLMRLEGLCVYTPRKRKYSSYIGEVSPSVPNVLQRDFHAELPNQKWLTDITEFSIPAGKVYLSPIIDCFDGMPVSWRIGCSPSAQMANAMLRDAIASLKPTERPIIHSDRGGHYRWPEWIKITSDAGLTRSMSKKGCSPDNSACEGFFGRLKNEMFYGKSWEGLSLAQFMASLDSYMHWYKEKRIKVSLGGLSPLEYREALGLT
jgi:transposase InsO family protein/transposase-like protein